MKNKKLHRTFNLEMNGIYRRLLKKTIPLGGNLS
jgi:hypothetical protein